jgi:hypothetical protein
MTVVGELARYKLDLVGVQEVRWDKAGTIQAGDYALFYGKGNDDPGVDGRIILKWIFERLGGRAQTGLIWLRIGTDGGLLCIRW